MRLVSGSGSSSGDDGDGLDSIRLRSAPDNQLPVSVGTSILLGRTDELAVAVSALRVYRNGVEFTISARCRGELARRGGMFGSLSNHPHPHHNSANEPFLLGFEFGDGRSVTNLSGWPPNFDDDDGPWLSGGSGSGSHNSADHNFFLAPLPPGDTLALIAAWPGLGISESRHSLDAPAIRKAAEQVVQLWPPDPERHEPFEPPPPPSVPPGSWFDRN